MLPNQQLLLCSFLFVCLASFFWAMLAFFVQPNGFTPGMRVISISGTLLAMLHFYALLSAVPVSAGRAFAAACLYGSSLALFWWAIAVNRKKPLSAVCSPDAPGHLVKNGPYRWIRHPFYTSYLLAWAAGLAGSGQGWLLAPTLAMLVLYLRAAVMEERKFARSPLARAYSRYQRRTGRFLPSVWKLIASDHLD